MIMLIVVAGAVLLGQITAASTDDPWIRWVDAWAAPILVVITTAALTGNVFTILTWIAGHVSTIAVVGVVAVFVLVWRVVDSNGRRVERSGSALAG